MVVIFCIAADTHFLAKDLIRIVADIKFQQPAEVEAELVEAFKVFDLSEGRTSHFYHLSFVGQISPLTYSTSIKKQIWKPKCQSCLHL